MAQETNTYTELHNMQKRQMAIIEVIKEKEFESPSGASTVCCGYSSNGWIWIDWHDKNGVQIKKYKKDINN